MRKKNKTSRLSAVRTHNNDILSKNPSIKTPLIPLANFSFVSIYPWLKSIKIDGFSNMLSDESEFAEKIYKCITKIIPTLYKESDKIFGKHNKAGFNHCHSIRKDDPKIEELKKICGSIHDRDFSWVTDEDYKNYEWYQVGISQGIRIFGIYDFNEKSFFPLFCDWNHSFYGDDPKNNTKDIDKYGFDPYSNYSK